MGLAASLRLINELGSERIEAHVRGLTERLRAGLERAGVRLATPADSATRSGITVFRCSDDSAREQVLVERLLDQRIYVSLCYTSGMGGIRVSTHFYNPRTTLGA